jgi:ketosteroid isomerase-like protein
MSLRHSAILLTLVASVTSAAAAQQPKPASSDERAVLDLEDAWAKGVVKRDAATFRRLLAPGFVYTEDDQVQTADQVINGIVSGTDTVTTAVNEKLETHPFGNTMIVTGWLVMRGRSAGRPFQHRYRFTDTWLKRNGQWQIIAAQDYLVPAGRR